jgi:hypothetical protein
MFVRGLDEGELAAIAKVSAATITSMLAGKSVQMATLYRVATALKHRPPVPELEILSPYEPDALPTATKSREQLDAVVDAILERIVAKLREQSSRLREEEDRQYRRHRRELELNRGSANADRLH